MSAYLVLDSGEVFPGISSHGSESVGEVVFNTSHSGYEEIATDPSYFSQIIVMTAPMMGNYGVDPQVWESKQIWIKGFICLQIQNSKRDQSWSQLLKSHGVPILSGLDTRKLVMLLRDKGTPLGAIVEADGIAEAKLRADKLILEKKPKDHDWVFLASTKEGRVIKGQRAEGPRIAVLDFGAKENIIRELAKRSSEIKVFNSRTTPVEIQQWQPDALMLTNGPGDPADVKVAPETVRSLLGTIPIFGICMGHQILSLALGAKTEKLRFGHRGSNHPIRDTLLQKIYMTAQNHGYVVIRESLPSFVEVSQTNLNDNSVAGIFSKDKKILGIQYHPESCPGPHDAVGLFDFFVDRMVGSK